MSLVAGGCPGANQQKASPALPFSGQKLEVTVIGDKRLADAILTLESDWKSSTGGELSVLNIEEKSLLGAASLAGDVVIYPAYFIGDLAEKDLLEPLSVSLQDNPEVDWKDLYETGRSAEGMWGTSLLALPFGSPQLFVYYRADLLQKCNKTPPRTWDEYLALAEFFSERKNLPADSVPTDHPWFGSLEPLGKGWAGVTLLAHAAPYAKQEGYLSTLFDIESMTPLIDQPPFVRALEDLVMLHSLASEKELAYSPHDVRRAFWRGETALALTWPSRSAPKPESASSIRGIELGLAPLPGSKQVYRFTDQQWDERADDKINATALLSIDGRLVSVKKNAAHAEAARRFLIRLTGKDTGRRIASVSPGTTLFRRSQAQDSDLWVEADMPEKQASQYASLLEKTSSTSNWLPALRIPGRERYLSALEQGVHAAARGEKEPQEALKQVAQEWEQITLEIGIDAQKRAYRHSLGLP